MTIKDIMIRAILLLAFISVVALPAFPASSSVPVANQISAAVINYLTSKDASYQGKRMEVSFKYAEKTFKELKYRKGNVTYAVAELFPDFMPLGNVIIPIQVTVDDEPKEKIFLKAKVSVYDNIVVSKKRMKRGDLIESDTVTIESRDIAALSSSPLNDMGMVFGREAKTFIPAGNAVYEWMIRERSFVKKDEKIRIIASSPNVSVVAAGIALQDGQLGQEIRVKNLSSSKQLTAIVTGTAEVQIKQ